MDLKFLIALIVFILLFKILINITKKIIFLIFIVVIFMVIINYFRY
ncbi:hypothetical protein JMUB3936_1880 [Leptotrichia wadei]|jgi:hypothetical protein|uniref:Uncharacterized protein n=1 Tax=Leptotrichia wadei TaxID=157687 RepID=A0A510KVE0_9FUSO|nr:hypothetical protein JMUB3936_1880 [Leptotrichia wadei]VTX73083.1 Uncharacterised protein [uncultured Leptotrichia sp.]